MEDADFSDEFCRFLQSSVPTVEAAELLLVLFADPAAAVRPKNAGEAKILQSFHAGGLAMASVDQAYQYRPSNRSEEHTSELQSQSNLVCRLLLEKKKNKKKKDM